MDSSNDWMGKALSLEAQKDLLSKEIELLSITNLDKVKKFHEAFNMKVSPTNKPDITDSDALLRMRLIDEEYKEVIEAIELRDPYKIAKELADLLYVVYGTAVSFGIDLDEVFDIVHRSNMTKLGEDGKPIYRDDGKILKSENYVPADLSEIFEDI